ncbi:flagellar hook-associated protein FlgK [Marinomonas ostreistagni]|uniref:flagellar hook-associated protein FlgK n=1 Tax=Marinomonas ostreistagni TaxID=359209 RepID=UPI0019502F7C|nr:flagellar hook-associated protein FlgK [Marinomonas ostreistagni]MBM6551139.1 flagellar hook-associated protein FlgK [Marinomonas ostreistagni]
MSSLYSIGLSGLQSSTARITTTGQNTANVDTEGYSRQKTATVSQQGGGVRVQDTDRIVNKYLNQQLQSDTANYNFYDSYHTKMRSFDSLFGEESISVATYLENAFSALQTANSDATDSAARANAYQSFDQLAGQYNELAGFINEQRTLASDELVNNNQMVNNLTGQIADLNAQIFRIESASSNSANELRDRQDQLVRDLSEYLSVKSSYDSKGLMNVNLSSGQPLVLGDRANEFKLITDASDPDSVLKAEIDFGRYSVGVPADDLGGSTGGLLAFRNEFITASERMLGQQALTLSDTMNEQNKLGLDINGDYGNDLFRTRSIDVSIDPENSNPNVGLDVRVSAGQSADVTTDSYELVMTSNSQFKVVNYDMNGRISRESDIIDTGTATPNADGYYEIEGFGVEVSFGALASYNGGDRFEFVPTKTAASSLTLNARTGDDFALSAPIDLTTPSESPFNLSDAQLEISSITSTDPATSKFTLAGGLEADAPVELRFTDSDTVRLYDASGNPVGAEYDLSSYNDILEQAFSATPLGYDYAGPFGYDVSLNGTPQAGDRFYIGFNDAGNADNYNGLKLAELQVAPTVGGTQTYAQGFTSLVTEVGSVTASLETNTDASEAIMNRTEAARDEVSAVSLDEEAVNLLRFQQSYTASAQVLTAAQNTFSTLISALR